MSTTNPGVTVLRNAYQKSVAAYWNDNQQDKVNLVLGDIDGLYHHHFGIGDYDPSVLEGPQDSREDRITNELHRLETAQADLLLDHLGDITPGDGLLALILHYAPPPGVAGARERPPEQGECGL